MQFGNLDQIGRVVSGWAIDLSQIDQRCIIDIYIDGFIAITACVGDLPRPDAAISVGSGHITCGFSLDIGPLLKNDSSEVSIKFNSTGQLIPGENPFIAKKRVSKIHVFEGSDNYLFYLGDRNNVIDQMFGVIPPRDEDVWGWADRICLTEAATKHAGGKFLFAVAPDKIAIAPNLLSDNKILVSDRTVTRLSAYAAATYGIKIMYPLANMTDSVNSTIWLSKNDSHLNMRAHHFIFQQICKQLDLPVVLEPEWIAKPIVHDLAIYGDLNEAEMTDLPSFSSTDTEMKVVRIKGSNTIVYINPKASIPLIFMSGHSSCNLLSTFFKEVSQVTVVFCENFINTNLVRKFKPNYVIQYYSERNLYGGTYEEQSGNISFDSILVERTLEVIKLKEKPNLCLSHLETGPNSASVAISAVQNIIDNRDPDLSH